MTVHSHKLKITPRKAKVNEIMKYLGEIPAQESIESHIEAVKTKF